MSTPQRECCPLLMVELRRLPPAAVVALGAACDLRLCELPPVDVLVAVLAGSGRRFEVHVD